MAEPPKKVQAREERDYAIKDFVSILAKFRDATTEEKMNESLGELQNAVWRWTTLLKRAKSTKDKREDLLLILDELDEDVIEFGSEDALERGRDDIITILEDLIRTLKTNRSAKDISNVMATERDFLSEKVPKDLAEDITLFLTGKKGSIESQMNQIRAESGKPPLPPKKEGGRKTKKNRSRRKKTHGRRV